MKDFLYSQQQDEQFFLWQNDLLPDCLSKGTKDTHNICPITLCIFITFFCNLKDIPEVVRKHLWHGFFKTSYFHLSAKVFPAVFTLSTEPYKEDYKVKTSGEFKKMAGKILSVVSCQFCPLSCGYNNDCSGSILLAVLQSKCLQKGSSI